MFEPNKSKKSTRELMEKLLQSQSDIDSTLAQVDDSINLPPLHEHLAKIIEEHGETPQRVFEKVIIERTMGHRVMNGVRMTSRNVLLRIACVLSLSVEETQLLLQTGRKAQLYPRIRRDAIIIYGLSHRFALDELETKLVELGERSLYERY